LKQCTENGINALQLIGEIATAKDFAKAEAFLQVNYGQEYQAEKFNLLWQLVKEDGWTTERLEWSVKQFIKNNRWKNWTVADFYEVSNIKLYPYCWYVKNITQNGIAHSQMEGYKIDGIQLYKMADGVILPFEKTY